MSEDRQHDLRGFIQGMNKILENLPHTRLEDTAKTSLHYKVLTPEIFGEKSADFLFLVVRYNSEDDTYYLLGHSPEHLSNEQKLAELENILGDDHPCFAQDETQIFWLDQHGMTMSENLADIKPQPTIESEIVDTEVEEIDELFELPKIQPIKLATSRKLSLLGIFKPPQSTTQTHQPIERQYENKTEKVVVH